MARTITTKNLGETHALAVEFITYFGHLMSKIDNEALVVGLHGDLSSGKTAFTQGLAKALGIEEQIVSPTFVLMKKYEIPRISNLEFRISNKLIHIDAYRLDSGHELEVLRWRELMADANNFIVLEWPERVTDAMPENYLRLDFKFIDETTREITLPYG